ncbi:hypothetical protein HETIRDRAFT_409047 [Heterobasidion irregulare TC 32-1]|uniref:Uncharacterized protein n=1 Tax=Heterobasidion irregulare (strain TC 32-1) TaxID=747525 RepID=W4KBC1_HETIT|nr:uncharacterized protein HETIRDRAFT_409047 [Heterobasidion irregulare TC 32-1]ETW83098.1 hypothetical protein HETIRDRAFT_409047 [Heterobasidion irregulare TC 32-1]
MIGIEERPGPGATFDHVNVSKTPSSLNGLPCPAFTGRTLRGCIAILATGRGRSRPHLLLRTWWYIRV